MPVVSLGFRRLLLRAGGGGGGGEEKKVGRYIGPGGCDYGDNNGDNKIGE